MKVNGHGRLMEPPSRGSLFRFKDDPVVSTSPYAKDIKPNYNDNQLFCGGVQVKIISTAFHCIYTLQIFTLLALYQQFSTFLMK